MAVSLPIFQLCCEKEELTPKFEGEEEVTTVEYCVRVSELSCIYDRPKR